jgi:hypothetical protein
VNFGHCQKTWSGVSSDAPHVQVPFGTILKRARLRQGLWPLRRRQIEVTAPLFSLHLANQGFGPLSRNNVKYCRPTSWCRCWDSSLVWITPALLWPLLASRVDVQLGDCIRETYEKRTADIWCMRPVSRQMNQFVHNMLHSPICSSRLTSGFTTDQIRLFRIRITCYSWLCKIKRSASFAEEPCQWRWCPNTELS